MTPTHPTQASVGEVRHTPMIVAAARELCKRSAGMCEVDFDDAWKIYGNDYIADAQAMFEVAGIPELIGTLSFVHIMAVRMAGNEFAIPREAVERVDAAIARATSLPSAPTPEGEAK